MMSNRRFVRSWGKTVQRALRVGLHAFLLAAITSELTLPSAYILHAAEAKNAQEQKESNRTMAKLAVHSMMADPLLETIEKLELPKEGPLPANHPSIDRDPFFLRSQVWIPRGEDFVDVSRRLGRVAYDFAVEESKDATTLHWRGSVNKLRLPSGLQVTGITANYIVLSAKEGSNLFNHERQGLPKDQKVGQGIFVISLLEFFGCAIRRHGVPIYFLPLPDEGWTGALKIVELPTQRKIVVANSAGDYVPLDLEDIELLLNLARINLLMGYGLALHEKASELRTRGGGTTRVDPRALARAARTEKNMLPALQAAMGSVLDRAGIENLVPPVGSTAMFGSLFTGYDFDHPSNSLFSMGARTSLHQMKKRLERFARNLLWISSAHADDSAWEILEATFWVLAPKLLWTVGLIFGVTVLVSWVQKYTYLKGHFKKRDDEAWGQGVRAGVAQEIADISDVVAHNLTVLKTIPYLLAEQGVGFLLDRFLADSTSARNTWVRAAFNNTFERYAKNNTNQRVNWRTLLEGVAILGVIDSVMVSVVMCFINPWIWGMVGNSLEGIVPSLNAHIDKTFAITNAGFMAFAVEESARNWIAWVGGGSNSRAEEFAAQGDAVARPIAERMVASMQFNNEKERQDKVEEIVNKVKDTFVAMQGGPTEEDFIYDAQPAMQWLRSALGYPTPDDNPLYTQEQVFAEGTVPAGVLEKVEEFVNLLRDARVAAGAELTRLKIRHAELKKTLTDNPEAGEAATEMAQVEHNLRETTKNLAMTEKMLEAQEKNLRLMGSKKVDPLPREAQTDSYAQLRKRSGLYTPALQRAISFLRAELERTKDPTVKAAVECLEKHLQDTSVVEAYVLKPANLVTGLLADSKERLSIVGNVRKFRSTAMMLLYDKALDSNEVRHLPGDWAEAFGQPGAQLAALAFQNAYGGYVAGKVNEYLPTGSEDYQLDGAATKAAAEAIAARYQCSPADAVTQHYAEFKLLAFRHATKAREKREQAMVGVDPREGASNFYLRWQLEWARNRAIAEFQAQTQVSADPYTLSQDDGHFATFRDIFTREVMRQAGIYPDYASVPGLQQKIEELVDERLKAWENKEGVKLKMQSLANDTERSRFREEVRAIFATETYLSEVSLKHEVAPLSPAQVGVLQPLRQGGFSALADTVCAWLPKAQTDQTASLAQWLGGYVERGVKLAAQGMDTVSQKTGLSTAGTVVARIYEGMFPREAHALGIMPQISRVVPLFSHFWDNGVMRVIRVYPPYMTGVFLMNWLVWGSKMTYPMFAWNTVWFFGLFGSRAWIESSLRNVGFETQNSIKGAVVHALFYGFLTNLVYGPMNLLQPFYDDAVKWCGQVVTDAAGLLIGK